jgi:steroid 5-alpha reductase family enzyme
MTNLSGWLASQVASIPVTALPLFVLTLAITAVGFYRRVYFVSIGYGFSIAAMSLVTLFLFRDNLTLLLLIQAGLLIIYGARLGGFLLHRELTQPAYRKQLQETHERGRNGRSRDLIIWLGVSVLYVIMFSPTLFMLATPAADLPSWSPFTQVIGLIIMATGMFMEALADRQKFAFKTANPKAFCNVGLYRFVRCPNYLGEIMVWIGQWIASLPAYTSLVRVVIGLAGLICIVLIMMGSTKRLEESQDQRYGTLSDYQRYIKTVPVLFPFVPIYSLKRVRVYLE